MKAKVQSDVKVTLTFKPGEWVLDKGTWSVQTIEFTVYRTPRGLWFTHVCLGNFRAWTRNYQNTAWAKETPRYPGFWPRMEIIPEHVLKVLREAYESEAVTPEYLPMPEYPLRKDAV